MKLIFTVSCCGFFLFGGFFVQEISAATCTVNALTDTGAGSGANGDLRYCINQSNASGGADTINFSVGGTILLNSSLPIISDSVTIEGNGGISVDGQNQSGVVPFSVNSGAVVSLNSLTVMRGKGINPNGGCLQVLGSTLNLTNVTVDNCSTTAESGGGIRSEGSSLNITNSRIINNHMIVVGSSGSGIFVTGGSLTMRESIVSGNTLPNSDDIGGAGIELFRVPLAQIENSTVSNNINGNYGAGINNNNGNLRMSNVTVSNNSGGVQAGGVANISGTAVLRNCTIAGNSVTRYGGGIFNGGTATLTIANTIIADNSAGIEGMDFYNFATLTKVGANIIETAVVNSATINGAGTIINVDPLLLPLNNYGGIIKTQPLNPNSVARNAGINSEALDTNGVMLTTDTRGAGFPRFIETTVDLGAFESSVPSVNYQISGRVNNISNRVLRSRAIVRLTNLTTGEKRFAPTNPFGFYRFLNVPAGANVRVEIMAKNAVFAPQNVIVAGEINNLNFTASP